MTRTGNGPGPVGLWTSARRIVPSRMGTATSRSTLAAGVSAAPSRTAVKRMARSGRRVYIEDQRSMRNPGGDKHLPRGPRAGVAGHRISLSPGPRQHLLQDLTMNRLRCFVWAAFVVVGAGPAAAADRPPNVVI